MRKQETHFQTEGRKANKEWQKHSWPDGFEVNLLSAFSSRPLRSCVQETSVVQFVLLTTQFVLCREDFPTAINTRCVIFGAFAVFRGQTTWCDELKGGGPRNSRTEGPKMKHRRVQHEIHSVSSPFPPVQNVLSCGNQCIQNKTSDRSKQR